MMPARVMVVEDERIVALHLQQQLVKLGYGVPGVAASGEQALEQIEASRPDLVLMDIHIDGGIDGIETVARIPADYHIPVIYLTAYSEEATLERARATRPYGYLIKPFSERELHATIQMALERCSSEKALRKTEAALRQAQKVEAIGKLAGGVAHDFNNLLGVIIGNLEFIADRTRVDADVHEMVQDALDAALRSANLTQTLLAYSRRQPLVPRVLSIEGLVSNLTELLRRTVGATIEIRTQIPAHLWRVRVDSHQFDTALLNLTVNARDAMPRGGLLTIEADNVVLDQSYADRHLEVAAGRYVLIAVTDTGTGMPTEVTDKVLDPFFTTKPAGKGTGLGLSMVYGFVKQSHGHLEISSEAGRGTTIKLYFPVAENWDEDLNQPLQPAGALGASDEGEA
jgi:signal transduction histidine kinase